MSRLNIYILNGYYHIGRVHSKWRHKNWISPPSPMAQNICAYLWRHSWTTPYTRHLKLAARNAFLKSICHWKLLQTMFFYRRFLNKIIKMCYKYIVFQYFTNNCDKKVLKHISLRPEDSFLAFKTQYAARTVIWVWHACLIRINCTLGSFTSVSANK